MTSAAALDYYWVSVADFVRRNRHDDESVMAPLAFGDLLGSIYGYPQVAGASPDGFDWVIVHKGEGELDPEFLKTTVYRMLPVFANEVFVVYTRRKDLKALDDSNPHVRALVVPVAFSQPAERPDLAALSRAAVRAAELGDGVVLCRVLGKYMCYVDVTDPETGPPLVFDGCLDLEQTEKVRASIRAGSRCFDLNAGSGYFTLIMADAVGPTGHVVAVEPDERRRELISRSLRVNGLSDRVTVQELVTPGELAQADFVRIKST